MEINFIPHQSLRLNHYKDLSVKWGKNPKCLSELKPCGENSDMNSGNPCHNEAIKRLNKHASELKAHVINAAG